MKRTIYLLVFLLVFPGCTKETPLSLVKRSKPALGTIVEISVADKDRPEQAIYSAIEKAFQEIERVETLLSRYNRGSDVSRINQTGSIRPTKVSRETINLLEKSIVFSQFSDGAFDITVVPVMQAWGLNGKSKQHPPSFEQLQTILGKVGYQHINIIGEEQAVFLGVAGMSIDLGGIAKGYAIDRAIKVLKDTGIKSALVNAGGDMYALQGPAMFQKWQVALQHPRKKDQVLTVLEIQDRAVATSGDYERYIEINGKRYSHIIDPRSGFPCANVPASVTVLAQDCLTADALATAIMVLGPDKGLEMLEGFKNADAVIISVYGDKINVRVSPGLEGKLNFRL